MKEFVDVLDEAVSQLRDGDELDKILVDFLRDAPELAPLLESAAALAQLQPVEMPARADLAADRYHFLKQAEQLRERHAAAGWVSTAGLAVSPGILARLKMWTQKTFRWPFPARTEERQPMFALLVKMIVIATIGLGAAGGTVAAANDSLPDTALYPIKIGIEDVRLALANGPAEEAELTMEYVNARVQEMRQLALAGEVPTEALMNRFYVQLQTTLRHMAQVDEDVELSGLLLQTRQQIRVQVDVLDQTQLQVREQARVRLEEAQGALVRAGDDIDAGIAEPALYRYRYAENRPEHAPDQPEFVPPAETPLENKEQQKGPADNAPGAQDGAEHEAAPVWNWADEGPYGADSEDPVRNRTTEGPYYGDPGENQQGPGGEPVEPSPGGDDGGQANQNQYQNQNENSQDIMSQEQEQKQNQEQEGAPAESPAPVVEPPQGETEPPANGSGQGD